MKYFIHMIVPNSLLIQHAQLYCMKTCPHLVILSIVEEVRPVGVCLHEPELKQLPQTQLQDFEADL